MRMLAVSYLVLGAILLFVSLGSVNANACDIKANDPCGKVTEWNRFETIRLQMTQDGVSAPLIWYFQSSSKNQDFRVDFESSDPHSLGGGAIIMVEGSVFVSKGVELTSGSEIDALDVPVLYIILIEKILSCALPDGPRSLAGKKRQFKFEDKTTGIQFATPSAGGFIPPPWSVEGTVTPNADESFDFDLSLRYSDEQDTKAKRDVTAKLSGQLKHSDDFHIDDAMSLDGWTVLGVGPIVEKTPNGEHIDYGTQPTKEIPKTIADIRKRIAKAKSPGEPDLSRNYAGFWKAKCDDTFGLRIKSVNEQGMYTVTFCGPGGCGDDQEERRTYIVGDQHYNIVSETELQVGPPGNRSTYKKCSDGMLP